MSEANEVDHDDGSDDGDEAEDEFVVLTTVAFPEYVGTVEQINDPSRTWGVCAILSDSLIRNERWVLVDWQPSWMRATIMASDSGR